MSKLTNILDASQRQTSLDNLLADIEAEESEPTNGNGFEPGASVGHVDFADFRAVYVGPGKRADLAKVKVIAGWTCEPPRWPVTIPYSKLTEVH